MDINLWVGFVRLYNFMVINVKKDWCNENKKKEISLVSYQDRQLQRS